MAAVDNVTGPYASIAYITTRIGNTVWQGSGAIIGPHTILTASHVLWSWDNNAGASSVTVRLGSATAPVLGGDAVWHYNEVNNAGEALTKRDSQADYAVINVEADLSGYVSFGMQAGYTGGAVHVTGFPASAHGTMDDDVVTVTADARYGVLNLGAGTALSGESGGPVWVEGSSGPIIVGVVSTSAWADQLTFADIAQIRSWQAQDAFLWAEPEPQPLKLPHPGVLVGNVDSTFYLAHNPDVAAAGMNAIEHYEKWGWREGRDPNALFSTREYLSDNHDVAAAGLNPLKHYEAWGWREGRDPSSHFDVGGYLAANPDVAAAGIDPLYHFLHWGFDEGRQGWDL